MFAGIYVVTSEVNLPSEGSEKRLRFLCVSSAVAAVSEAYKNTEGHSGISTV